MDKVMGARVMLQPLSREAYHQARRIYAPDPLMDPAPYAYDEAKTDAAYDRMLERASWYPEVGIFLHDGTIIGLLSFKRIDREKGRCELGIALCNDAFKGHGYGGEAFALAVSYAFDALDLRQVYADTMGSNIRMQRILHRLGFRCILRLQEAYNMGDRWEDRLDYVLDRSAYPNDRRDASP